MHSTPDRPMGDANWGAKPNACSCAACAQFREVQTKAQTFPFQETTSQALNYNWTEPMELPYDSILEGTGYRHGDIPTFGEFILNLIREVLSHTPFRWMVEQVNSWPWNGWQVDI